MSGGFLKVFVKNHFRSLDELAGIRRSEALRQGSKRLTVVKDCLLYTSKEALRFLTASMRRRRDDQSLRTRERAEKMTGMQGAG